MTKEGLSQPIVYPGELIARGALNDHSVDQLMVIEETVDDDLSITSSDDTDLLAGGPAQMDPQVAEVVANLWQGHLEAERANTVFQNSGLNYIPLSSVRRAIILRRMRQGAVA
jgi:hypothetical protein